MLLEDNFEVELEKEEVGNRIVPLDEVIVIDETAGVRTHRLEDAAVVVVRAVVARMFTAWAESVWVVANISFFCYVWQRYGVSFILFLPYSHSRVFEKYSHVFEKKKKNPHSFVAFSTRQNITTNYHRSSRVSDETWKKANERRETRWETPLSLPCTSLFFFFFFFS